MNDEELKKQYGDEFPKAVTIGGIRMPLQRETRFSRYYHNEEKRYGATVPKFFDGSAEITLSELKSEWPSWTKSERHDFVEACSHMKQQPDLPDILRFVMSSDDPNHLNSVALAVSFRLPMEEAFALLLDALTKANGRHTANLTQAIAKTKHPNAVAVLRKHLEEIWTNPELLADDPFINWVAFDAQCCIQQLIELGAPASEFEEKVRTISKHTCKGNRESLPNFLSEHYSWLKS